MEDEDSCTFSHPCWTTFIRSGLPGDVNLSSQEGSGQLNQLRKTGRWNGIWEKHPRNKSPPFRKWNGAHKSLDRGRKSRSVKGTVTASRHAQGSFTITKDHAHFRKGTQRQRAPAFSSVLGKKSSSTTEAAASGVPAFTTPSRLPESRRAWSSGGGRRSPNPTLSLVYEGIRLSSGPGPRAGCGRRQRD